MAGGSQGAVERPNVNLSPSIVVGRDDVDGLGGQREQSESQSGAHGESVTMKVIEMASSSAGNLGIYLAGSLDNARQQDGKRQFRSRFV